MLSGLLAIIIVSVSSMVLLRRSQSVTPHANMGMLNDATRKALEKDLSGDSQRSILFVHGAHEIQLQSNVSNITQAGQNVGVWGIAIGYDAKVILKFSLPLRRSGFEGMIFELILPSF